MRKFRYICASVFLASITLCVLCLTACREQSAPSAEPGSSQIPIVQPKEPIVEAIRWDAWVSELTQAGHDVEAALNSKEYHDRLPFYAKVESDGDVKIDGNSDEIMSREIAYAADAGLDYWTFLWDPNAGFGRDLYLENPDKDKINWCQMLTAWSMAFEKYPQQSIAWLTDRFQDENYQKVSGGRPLLYLYNAASDASPFADTLKSIRDLCAKKEIPMP